MQRSLVVLALLYAQAMLLHAILLMQEGDTVYLYAALYCGFVSMRLTRLFQHQKIAQLEE